MKTPRLTKPDVAMLLGWLSVLPLLIWWLGWFPGFLSPDSIDQLGQVDRFEFFNFHPIAHTFSMWVVTRVWDHPGAVTLLQVLLLAGLLGFLARRLTQVGVPWWLAVAAAWITAALPMVGATTITIWKDIPYSLAMVWAFAELVALARDRGRFWSSWWGPLRLGTALGLDVGAAGEREGDRPDLRGSFGDRILAPLASFARSRRCVGRRWDPDPRRPAVAVLSVNPGTIEPAQVFLPDVAAVVVNDPDWFSDADVERLEAIAPIEFWQDKYECTDSTPLVWDPKFKHAPARQSPWEYRSLVARTAITHLPTVLGHRWCAASFLFVPWARGDSYLHRPPFEIYPNTLGIARDSISERAYSFTFAQYQWIEKPGVLWFTWRPALVVLAGIATYVGMAVRRRLRPLLWAGGLIGAQLLNVAAMTPAHEFRYAFGIYLLSLMSLPFWWLIIRPYEAAIEPVGRLDSSS